MLHLDSENVLHDFFNPDVEVVTEAEAVCHTVESFSPIQRGGKVGEKKEGRTRDCPDLRDLVSPFWRDARYWEDPDRNEDLTVVEESIRCVGGQR